MEDEKYLKEMGFPESKIKLALAKKGHLGLQAAMEWILEHGNDPEPETPIGSAGVIAEDQSSSDVNNETATKKEDDDLTKEEKLKKMQEKIEMRRKEKEEADKQMRIEQEKRRRKEGQELAKLKSELEYRETQKIVDERKRDKMADKLARQRVKEQIAQDREDRKRREQKEKEERMGITAPVTQSSSVDKPAAAVKIERPTSSETRLQMVLPDGSKMVQTFQAQEPLSAVRVYISLNRKDSGGTEQFGLMTAFPRKIFTEEDYDVPLYTLGLTPSAVLHVKKTV